MTNFSFTNVFSAELSSKTEMDAAFEAYKQAIKDLKTDEQAYADAMAAQNSFRQDAFEFAREQKWDVDKVLAHPKVSAQWLFYVNSVDAAKAAVEASKLYEQEMKKAYNDIVGKHNAIVGDMRFIPAKK
jgi:hypothetical protein